MGQLLEQSDLFCVLENASANLLAEHLMQFTFVSEILGVRAIRRQGVFTPLPVAT